MVDGNGTESGHIIVTVIGGRNGQPKQITFKTYIIYKRSEIPIKL